MFDAAVHEGPSGSIVAIEGDASQRVVERNVVDES